MSSTTNFFANLKKLSNSKEQSTNNNNIKEDRKDSGISLLPSWKGKQETTEGSTTSSSDQRKSNESTHSSFFSSWGSSKSLNKDVDSDRSPYFIQTWWDPRMPGAEMKEGNTSPRSRPLSLVSYLPPIWVEEEMEKVSPDETLVNDDEISIMVSMYDDDEQSLAQDQIPTQDYAFLTVPVQNSISSHAIPTSNREEPSKTRKVRFEIGARLDPNEDCLLNFAHPIHAKRQHRHTNRCHHVRFVLEGKEGEVIKNTTPRSPNHKVNHELTSCLKIASKTEQPLKSILRTTNNKKTARVTFDEHISTHTVDRHIEWDQTVSENRSLRRTIRARKLEKRRQLILTKPIEQWIDDVEQDEGLPIDGEDNEEEYSSDEPKYQYTQDEQFERLLSAFSDDEDDEPVKTTFLEKRQSHTSMEHLEFTNAQRIRFERQWLPKMFLESI
ncbi:uncharacterized protein FA14DRAFT_179926 [Meira miltonrushii]|uniref:Uncharacterized protein n=1 Tax=Meira miltonrushii TaxID=1280837 RepID=A0A316V754_9BASI|nr:uncharacterized protein FA14DRAFT_179926 [Meira miltonrushii]PWN33272.1 hypothetical protein FA14DRAFT_179926 [Meira miltonrushii]